MILMKTESNEKEVKKILNDFFSNIVNNLKIPEYQCSLKSYKEV